MGEQKDHTLSLSASTGVNTLINVAGCRSVDSILPMCLYARVCVYTSAYKYLSICNNISHMYNIL